MKNTNGFSFVESYSELLNLTVGQRIRVHFEAEAEQDFDGNLINGSEANSIDFAVEMGRLRPHLKKVDSEGEPIPCFDFWDSYQMYTIQVLTDRNGVDISAGTSNKSKMTSFEKDSPILSQDFSQIEYRLVFRLAEEQRADRKRIYKELLCNMITRPFKKGETLQFCAGKIFEEYRIEIEENETAKVKDVILCVTEDGDLSVRYVLGFKNRTVTLSEDEIKLCVPDIID